MKVQCPHCLHGHELTLAPGRQVLSCDACLRSFPFVAPEAPEGGASSAERGPAAPKRAPNEATQIITIAAPELPASPVPGPSEDAAFPTALVAVPLAFQEPVAAALPAIRPAQSLPPLPRAFPEPALPAASAPPPALPLPRAFPEPSRTPLPSPQTGLDEDTDPAARTAPVTLPYGSAKVPKAAREESTLLIPVAPPGPAAVPGANEPLEGRVESTLRIVLTPQDSAALVRPREQELPPPEAPAPHREDVTQRIPAPLPKETAPLPPAQPSPKEEVAPPVSAARRLTREQSLAPGRHLQEPSLPPGRKDKEASLPPGRHLQEPSLPPGRKDKEASLPPGRHLQEPSLPAGRKDKEASIPPRRTNKEPSVPPARSNKEPSVPPAAKKPLTPQKQTGSRPALSPAPTTGSRKALRAAAPERSSPEIRTEPHHVPALPARDVTSLSNGMRLGGYVLQRRLGAGAMGTVWLARQLSLDRNVALKVLRPSLARDPQFVYRFTQEAFAAAQLVHHNIVQIYDCGSEKRVHYFSMEYVDAENLLTLVERQGRLDPEVAAGYILQAARGLKFAHDRGMVHRDIKPDNLLLNRNGIVKVADLGLVKRSQAAKASLEEPDTDTNLDDEPETEPITTNPGAHESALGGTPAYMSPEQVENSSRVDARSDIYSLGCTFYYLLTGRPPFQSEAVAGVMAMHVLEPPVPPDERVRRVPKVLSDLVLKMLAKAPEERFQDMGELIRALESFLGIEGTVSFSPREEHANLLERCVQGFNQAAWVRRRDVLVFAFFLLCALATGLVGWRLGRLPALGVVAFAACTWMSSFLIRGRLQKETMFLHLREFVSQAPLLTWLIWLLILGEAGYAVYRFELVVPVAFVLGAALLTALGFYALVDRKVAAERKPFVAEVEQMLRSMRLKGLEENALRQFVCKYSGEVWEAFYEALFGYNAKLLARDKWGRSERGFLRETHATWREPLIRWMDSLQHARQQRRERRQLRVLERANSKAQGRTKAPATST